MLNCQVFFCFFFPSLFTILMLLFSHCAKESKADTTTEAELKKYVSFDDAQEAKPLTDPSKKPAEDAAAERKVIDAGKQEAEDDVFEDSKTGKDTAVVAGGVITQAEEPEAKGKPTVGEGKKELPKTASAELADEHPDKVLEAGPEATTAVTPMKEEEAEITSAEEIIAAVRKTESFKAEATSSEGSAKMEAAKEPEQVEKEDSKAETAEAAIDAEKAATESKAEEAGQEVVAETTKGTADTCKEPTTETAAESKAASEPVTKTETISETAIVETEAASGETQVAEAATDLPDKTEDSSPAAKDEAVKAGEGDAAAAGDSTEPAQAVAEGD